jgi:heavy metal translocating P-type ATPase
MVNKPSSKLKISYLKPGRLQLRNVDLLLFPDQPECQKFLAGLLQVPEIRAIEVSTSQATAYINFDRQCPPGNFLRRVGEELLQRGSHQASPKVRILRADDSGQIYLYRHGSIVSSWKVVSSLHGRIRARNSRLSRKKALCHCIERELMSVLGIERFRVNPVSCSVLVLFDTDLINEAQILELLEETLLNAEDQLSAEKNKHELLLCTVAVGLSVVAQFLFPILIVPSAILFVYCSIPTLIGAKRNLFQEGRLGVDVLDSIMVVACLISGEVFAGSVATWCLSLGRKLLEKAQEDSRRHLVNVFGKQPRTARVLKDGIEMTVSLDRIEPGEIVLVHTGEVIPVDGVVANGMAVVDQHALTGESVPVEKEPGDKVYASTFVTAGRIHVEVEKAGKESTSARITAILDETAAFRLESQSKGEELADKAVIPTIALASVGLATVGLQGATAIVNCDFGTGIRIAAPLALLSSLSVCANRGILVKDGRASEQIGFIDTILFDKTGTLTKECPTVHKIHVFGNLSQAQVLTYAAAAEHRLNHPIAAAIVEKFCTLNIPLPSTDQSSYRVGYGISVIVEHREVLVGSSRFMKSESVNISEAAEKIAATGQDEGNSVVFVALNRMLAGAIELEPTLRTGVRDLIAGLRERGVRQLVIISGDHQTPTRKLAQTLGVDRYFADVLPQDKARYVELLQSEGRKVCFVGDGINDSIALKRANVSISLRGATSVAIDTAQVVFMDEELANLCALIDISQGLDRNVKASWQIILGPNLFCIGGAFFFGFGVMASVLANNVASIAALLNGLSPLRMLSEPERTLKAKRTVRRLGLSKLGSHPANVSAAKCAVNSISTMQTEINNVRRLSPSESPADIHRLKKAPAFFLWGGFLGLLLPGIPGWPLLLVAIALHAPRHPSMSWIDRLIKKQVPFARGEALKFVDLLLRDLNKRYPDDSEINDNSVAVGRRSEFKRSSAGPHTLSHPE